MYYIKILNLKTNKTFTERFTSYYYYMKRVNKLRFATNLQLLAYGEE